MNTISIALLNRRSDAELLQKHLNEKGIRAAITEHYHLADVKVPAPDFEEAHHLLMHWAQGEGASRSLIRCPECGSMRVEYPQFAEKSYLPNVLIGIFAAVGATDMEFYCRDCHFTWPKEGTRPSRKRPHQAPYYFIEGIDRNAREEHAKTA